MTAADKAAISAGTPGDVLMERAGEAVAAAVAARFPKGAVAILAGPGDNGGDGYVVARRLKERGWERRGGGPLAAEVRRRPGRRRAMDRRDPPAGRRCRRPRRADHRRPVRRGSRSTAGRAAGPRGPRRWNGPARRWWPSMCRAGSPATPAGPWGLVVCAPTSRSPSTAARSPTLSSRVGPCAERCWSPTLGLARPPPRSIENTPSALAGPLPLAGRLRPQARPRGPHRGQRRGLEHRRLAPRGSRRLARRGRTCDPRISP